MCYSPEIFCLHRSMSVYNPQRNLNLLSRFRGGGGGGRVIEFY